MTAVARAVSSAPDSILFLLAAEYARFCLSLPKELTSWSTVSRVSTLVVTGEVSMSVLPRRERSVEEGEECWRGVLRRERSVEEGEECWRGVLRRERSVEEGEEC